MCLGQFIAAPVPRWRVVNRLLDSEGYWTVKVTESLTGGSSETWLAPVRMMVTRCCPGRTSLKLTSRAVINVLERVLGPQFAGR